MAKKATKKAPAKAGAGRTEETPTTRLKIGKRSSSSMIQELCIRLSRGEVPGCIEWVRRLSSRDDPELLRGLVLALADHIENPVKQPRGARKKKGEWMARDADGNPIFDLMERPLLTQREQRQELLRKVQDWRIYDAVCEQAKRFTLTGAFAEVARLDGIKESAVRAAYYRVGGDSD